jgi:hypothetical protein
MAFGLRVKGELFDTILSAFVSRSLRLLSESPAPLLSYSLSYLALSFQHKESMAFSSSLGIIPFE